MTFIVNCYKQSSRPSKYQTKILASQTHYGRVDYGHNVVYVFSGKFVEQFFVTILQITICLQKQFICDKLPGGP